MHFCRFAVLCLVFYPLLGFATANNHAINEQYLQQRITQLQQLNNKLEAQLKQKDQALLTLNQEVGNIKYNKNNGIFDIYHDKLESVGKDNQLDITFAAGLLILAGLILLWLFWPRRTEKLAERQAVVGPDSRFNTDNDDYDFMNSDEGIPAKLDLARAYIDMGEASTAKELLLEILASGTESQRMDAQYLLNQIPS